MFVYSGCPRSTVRRWHLRAFLKHCGLFIHAHVQRRGIVAEQFAVTGHKIAVIGERLGKFGGDALARR